MVAAQLHEQVRRLDAQYDRTPSTALLGSAGQLHGQVTLLRQNAGNARIRRALYEVEAESATFMSQLVWDVSQRRDHTAALAYLDEAVAAARHIHDQTLEAYATLRKSFIALYGAHDPATGVGLAVEASDLARASSTALAGLSLLHVAEGLAMMDDGSACERALGQAEVLLDQTTPDDLAAEYYTRSEYQRLAGSCYLSLARPERAETVLRPTVDSLASKQKSQAIAYGNLTLSLIRQRKLDEAAEAMHRTIDTIELTRGGGGLAVAFTAGRELRPWQHEPWVGDVHDRLLALMATL
ncbi:hypothetical protein Acsp03_71400 [Actinomadura sp. NBRC 104412]|nr:hypothetical protein Acsp03_71400 [Actinomadura sp. NBRC 104412]